MNTLADMKYVAYRKGEPTITDEEIAEYHAQLPEWQIVERDNVKQLERVFKFDNFSQALQFTNKVGELAEEVDHHPSLVTEWGKVTVTWWTHEAGGLHRNDFIMAARTDRAYSS
ncbi:MAG: 4a-hydroxytetrahydrobiopterin dehydratase [Candidatus Bipolaricaulia bacterium]